MSALSVPDQPVLPPLCELGILVNRSVSLKKARLEGRGFIMVLYLPKRCGKYHGIISMSAVGTVVISPKMLKLIFHTL